MVATFYRTLKPGGVLVIYTEHPSERILSYFNSKSQDWTPKHQKTQDEMMTVENELITKGVSPFSLEADVFFVFFYLTGLFHLPFDCIACLFMPGGAFFVMPHVLSTTHLRPRPSTLFLVPLPDYYLYTLRKGTSGPRPRRSLKELQEVSPEQVHAYTHPSALYCIGVCYFNDGNCACGGWVCRFCAVYAVEAFPTSTYVPNARVSLARYIKMR